MSELAIITGASAGIGKATAARFVARGWQVVNLARRACPVDGVENLTVDLSTSLPPGMLQSLADRVRNTTRTALVHSAGVLGSDDARSVDRNALAYSLAVNVTAPAALNRALLDALPGGSAIVFVGSTLGDKAVAGAYSYVTAKHAVNGLMRATCQDIAGSGLHTAVVSPGFTDTEMLRAHVGHDEGILAAIAGNVAHGRLIEPDEIAATIEFCVDNPVINGAVIHANLGQIER